MGKSSGILLMILITVVITYSCSESKFNLGYSTENVIVIVIDGTRYSESWGDSTHKNIPRLFNYLSKSGVVNTQFYNNGLTKTIPGHTGITTGNYEEIDNSGKELPTFPSFFQYWNREKQNKCNSSWIITSKDKLEVLNNCELDEFKDLYKPNSDCGINGLATGYRHDSVTYKKLIEVLHEYQPNLVLVNFREPDYSAHSGSWDNYLSGIQSSDEYAYLIWEYIQKDYYYRGKTTLFITNDHGRHLDSIANGFISHGDDCSGCRHINFFAFGPDFKQDIIIDTERELIDISATISELLQLDMEYSQGEVMFELFK